MQVKEYPRRIRIELLRTRMPPRGREQEEIHPEEELGDPLGNQTENTQRGPTTPTEPAATDLHSLSSDPGPMFYC